MSFLTRFRLKRKIKRQGDYAFTLTLDENTKIRSKTDNNFLSTVIGADGDLKLVDECYDRISTEIDNLRNLADEFSKFAKMPEPKLEPCNLNKLIRDTISLYENFPSKVNIDAQLAPNLPQVNLDSGQIKQVLHNLIKNAIEAMPDGGNLQVITSINGDMISIEIIDTGCGMSEKVRSELFTPYFTTKQKGTGLGMAVVQRIVEQHGGEIDVESQEGIGTTVRIRLRGLSNE